MTRCYLSTYKIKFIYKCFALLFYSNLDSLDDPSPPPAADDIPVDAVDAQVPLDSLYRVLHHGESAKGDSHRFSVSADPEDATSRVKKYFITFFF